MKKLLILLSVLTISGSAIPTTIAASPYPEKEILIRNKREKNEAWRLSDKILNVPKVRQTQQYWCGPAVGQSILQYFGLTNISPMQHHINESNSFQSSLAYRMNTEFSSGTTPNNFINALNNIIVQYNLNSRRLYSINIINYNYSINNFVNIIRNSLQNNTPVALAYRGNLPEYFTENSDLSNHFIIIDGITGKRTNTMRETGSNLTFHYMDPWTGTRCTFDSMLLRLLVSNRNNQGQTLESYLISYIPTTTETQIQRPNQTEPMDFSGQTCGYFQDCDAYLPHNIYSKNKHKH